MEKLSAAKFHSEPPSRFTSFDHLVGEREKPIRHVDAKRLGSCEVDDEIDLGRQLDRHVGGLRSFENPAGVVAGTAIGIGLARSVAHQESGLGETAQYADCGQRVASRQRGELSTSAEEE